MEKIVNKDLCTGCGACSYVCTHKCITMEENEEGFLYPCIDQIKCIDCGRCKKKCPVNNNKEYKDDFECYAAQNLSKDIVYNSSSGGMFYAIASNFLNDSNNVVIAARFDAEWNVVHDIVNSTDDLQYYMRSKYVQSTVYQIYEKIEDALDAGKKVLFFGTPCQVNAVSILFEKKAKNLYCVEFICHGVPSPGVWKHYLRSLKWDKITNVNFRDKHIDANRYCITISGIKGGREVVKSDVIKKSIYFRGFLNHFYLRPSCHRCNSKGYASEACMTVADFWGAGECVTLFSKEELSRGISAIIVRTAKGKELFELIKNDVKKEKVKLNEILKHNQSFYKASSSPVVRPLFFKLFRVFPFTVSVIGLSILNKLYRECIRKN